MEELVDTLKMTNKEQIDPFQVNQALVGMELHERDEKLLSYLRFLSEQFTFHHINFLHVVPRFDIYRSLMHDSKSPLSGQYLFTKLLKERMESDIKGSLPEELLHKATCSVREGEPLNELVKEAQKLNTDLLIIGQKRDSFDHGIAAKHLARHTSANALVVPEEAFNEIKHLVVPMDFSQSAIKSLRTAIAMKDAMSNDEIQITCVNVYEMPDLAAYKINKTHEQLHKMIEGDHWKAFEVLLENYVPEKDQDQINKVLIEKRDGRIAKHLLNFATEHNAGMIIMGASGHSLVDQIILGSVAENLLSINKVVPTLLIK